MMNKIINKHFKKKYSYDHEETLRTLINTMLKKHNVDFDYVKENQTINGTPWFQYFTWTTTEEKEFKDFFIKHLTTKCSPPMSKHRVEKEFSWFNLMYGLKIKDE